MLAERYENEAVEQENQDQGGVGKGLGFGEAESQFTTAARQRDSAQAHEKHDVHGQKQREEAEEVSMARAEKRPNPESQKRADEHQVRIVGHEPDLGRHPSDHHEFQKQRSERQHEQPDGRCPGGQRGALRRPGMKSYDGKYPGHGSASERQTKDDATEVFPTGVTGDRTDPWRGLGRGKFGS